MNTAVQDRSIPHTGTVSAGPSRLETLFARIAEGAARRDLERAHPHEALALIREARLGALRIPAADGGGGATFRELFDVVIRLAAADANVAHVLRNHYTFVERHARRPRDERERRWQRAVVQGALVGLAHNEPESPNVGDYPFATSLTVEGSGYRLNGKKYYSTGTLYADLVVVRARLPGGANASVVLPADREGLERLDDWDGFGQKLTGTGTTLLHNVRVEAAEVIPDAPGVGYNLPYASTLPQLFLTVVNAGILRAIAQDAAALVRRRERTFYFAPSARPVDDPILQQTVGEIASAAFAAEALVLAAGDALEAVTLARDEGQPGENLAHEAALKAAKAKVIVDELVLRAGGQLLDVGGASATRQIYGLDRHWRNARTLAAHNPRSYKARAVGDYLVNGTPLPPVSFF